MQTILELSHTKACAFFLESENYCTLNLPRYIDFDAIICFVKSKLKGKELKDVLANPKDMPSKFDGVNYKILVKRMLCTLIVLFSWLIRFFTIF